MREEPGRDSPGREGGARGPAGVAVALDFETRDAALEMVGRLGASADLYKVGLELFTRCGPELVRELRERDLRVFLDLKLHDIPHTVARAVAAAGETGAELVTVHAAGGTAMIRAAREAADEAGIRVLAVTVLTSLGPAELAEVRGGVAVDPAEEVVRLAGLATRAGAHGVVASPREVGALREHLGEGPLLVTPGIRLAGDPVHDQVRVAGPGEAVRAGADLLVVGRSITQAEDPAAALARVRDGIARAVPEAVSR